MPSPWSLSVTPAKMPETTHKVLAINSGHTVLHLSVHAGEVRKVNGQCTLTDIRPNWARVTPRTFTLAPGHHGVAHVKILHQPSKPTDLAIVFTTVPDHHGVGVKASVAAQMNISHASCGALSLPHTASSPVPYVAAGGASVIGLVAVCVALQRRMRNRGTRVLRD